MEKAMEASMGVGKSFTQLLRERQAGGGGGKVDGKDSTGGEKESLLDVFRREGRALTKRRNQGQDDEEEKGESGPGQGNSRKTTTLSG